MRIIPIERAEHISVVKNLPDTIVVVELEGDELVFDVSRKEGQAFDGWKHVSMAIETPKGIHLYTTTAHAYAMSLLVSRSADVYHAGRCVILGGAEGYRRIK